MSDQRGMKHGRLRGHQHVRPYQFVSAQLQYVNGKVNERKLPKLKSRKKDAIKTKEKWKDGNSMADRKLVLCSALCFLSRKYGKCTVKSIKKCSDGLLFF